MALATISISFEGDKNDVRALRHMAEKRGMTIARLIRTAVEEAHGDELLETRNRLFFVNGGSHENQTPGTKKAGSR